MTGYVILAITKIDKLVDNNIDKLRVSERSKVKESRKIYTWPFNRNLTYFLFIKNFVPRSNV